jgi:hypothetical protein
MGEINQLPALEQIRIIGILGDLTWEQFQNPLCSQQFECTQCNGTAYYCLRIDALRFYFTFSKEGILCRYVLTEHSAKNFCMRLGINSMEDELEKLDAHFLKCLREETVNEEEERG